MTTRIVTLAIVLSVSCMVTGCQTVRPWERGILSDYTIRSDRDPLQDELREHVYFTREASSGGRGVGGSGCGCN